MEALDPKTLQRLRIGLAALMLGLIFDAVDLQLNDIDVLHDIAAAVLLGMLYLVACSFGASSTWKETSVPSCAINLKSATGSMCCKSIWCNIQLNKEQAPARAAYHMAAPCSRNS